MLFEQPMPLKLQRKLQAMSEDALVALDVAFTVGISDPGKVGGYCYYVKVRNGMRFEFHHFRVGYAYFILLIVECCPKVIVWDVELRDGYPVYPGV